MSADVKGDAYEGSWRKTRRAPSLGRVILYPSAADFRDRGRRRPQAR